MEKATHYIECRHCTNTKSCHYYTMECILLKRTKSGRAKILLFGDRYYKREKRSIRYIDYNRLIKIKEV